MKAREGAIAPFSLMTVGLLMVLLASLLVFQSQQVSTTPADAGMTSIFEPKSGELILDQAPYVGGILGFVFALINRIFGGLFPGGGGPFAGTAGNAGNPGASGSPGSSTVPSGASQTSVPTQTVQSEPEPEPESQSLGQQIKCSVFNSLGMSC